MLFNNKFRKKELTLEELQFKEKQRMRTEELFYKAVKFFEENKNKLLHHQNSSKANFLYRNRNRCEEYLDLLQRLYHETV